MFRLLVIIFFFLSYIGMNEVHGQYRDPFASKSSRKRIKSNNKKGLFTNQKRNNKKLKKGRDPFSSVPKEKGAIGIFDDPFKSRGKTKYKPTGVDKKSFSKKEKRKAYYKKYNVNNIKTKQAQKSQNKYIRIRYK
ncbi:hypothetical protein OAF16_02520 [Flavobacteriales bacterium]|jgi:hypothetical protein|nr:hypothetical protein [Flavobacteriales bacterium]